MIRVTAIFVLFTPQVAGFILFDSTVDKYAFIFGSQCVPLFIFSFVTLSAVTERTSRTYRKMFYFFWLYQVFLHNESVLIRIFQVNTLILPFEEILIFTLLIFL